MFYKRLIDVTINHSCLSLEAQLASRRILNLLELRKEISEDLILGIKEIPSIPLVVWPTTNVHCSVSGWGAPWTVFDKGRSRRICPQKALGSTVAL